MIDEYLKKIIWIFNHPQPETIPSYYVSGLMPSHYLGIKKVIFLDNHEPEALLEHFKPSCIILSKAFGKKISLVAKLAKKKGIKVISIFDDWSFDNLNRSKINLPIAENSDFIIAKTGYACKEIKKYTNLECTIIPDPIRFNRHNVFDKISNPINACWFGMHTNHSSILDELNNIDKVSIQVNLTIISNSFEKFNVINKNNKFNHLKLNFIKWNNKSNEEIIKNEVVFLPYPNDSKRIVKSSNRIIDSLNLGRFTILSDVKHFNEFKEFTYFGDISNGLDWLLNNISIAKQITANGQKYVNDNYSLEKICKQWIKLFNHIIDN